jgi:hypothetical protein
MSEYNTTGIDTNFNAEDAQKVFEAQMRLEGARIQSGPMLGNWAQTFRSLFGGKQAEPTITAVLPEAAEFSPTAAVEAHLLQVRDDYSTLAGDPITDKIRGAGYVNLTDDEVKATVPSYMHLAENLAASPDGSHLLEEGKNGKLTLTADAKALATHLIDTFHAQTIHSSEYDLQNLFGHQLKLMYQALKHDESNPDIDMSLVHRIFSSARMQYARRMEALETARLEQEQNALVEVPQRPLEAPRRPRLELARRAIGATIGAALLGFAIHGFAERQGNALPTRAEAAAAATSTYTPIAISPTGTAEVAATATLDPAYVLPEVAPARTGGDMPSLLPEAARINKDSFNIRLFSGTEHEEVKSAYFEEDFATWEDFKAYVEKQEATSERGRFQPQTIDGLLNIPAGDPENNNHVILGHSKDGSKKGPFEPIQRGYLEGWLKEGMEMPFEFPNGEKKMIRIRNIQLLSGSDPSGIHYASPTYYSTWFDNTNQNIGVTCARDTSGDRETDDYIRFNLDVVDNVEILSGYGMDLIAPVGTFSALPR